MANVKYIYQWVFDWEGGLVYFPSEGQWTNKGVQEKTFYALSQKLLGVAPTLANLKALTDAQAKKFIDYYWNSATYGNRIKNQEAANLMFFAYWASGNTGIEKMQAGLRKLNPSILIDGVTGPQTVGTINNANSKTVNTILRDTLEAWFRYLGKYPQYAMFLTGWLNRLGSLASVTSKTSDTGGGGVAIAALLFGFAVMRN